MYVCSRLRIKSCCYPQWLLSNGILGILDEENLPPGSGLRRDQLCGTSCGKGAKEVTERGVKADRGFRETTVEGEFRVAQLIVQLDVHHLVQVVKVISLLQSLNLNETSQEKQTCRGVSQQCKSLVTSARRPVSSLTLVLALTFALLGVYCKH